MPTLDEKITTIDDYRLTTFSHPAMGVHRMSSFFVGTDALSLPSGIMTIGSYDSFGAPILKNVERLPKNMWWFHREIMRQYLEIYPKATRVINGMQHGVLFAHYMPHISRDDPTLIAYTATPEDGERDRQTRMTLGRFMRKYYTLFPDTVIAMADMRHRAELNPPVEFIVAEDDPDYFVQAYKAVNSCMSKSTSSFGDKFFHPVMGYCTPGFQLAILKNGDDKLSIAARSLVWINPDDPEDKRMVRTYGDSTLNTYLESKGFKHLSFEGAYLKTKVLAGNKMNDGRELLIVPYVDNGSPAKEADYNGYGVWDGGEKIILLKRSSSKYKVPDKYRTLLQAASGQVYMHPFPMDRTCAVSGKPINAMKEAFVEVWIDGKVDFALITETKGWINAHMNDKARSYFIAPDVPHFRHGVTTYHDSDANRQYCGHIKLNARLYPNEQQWQEISPLLRCVMHEGVVTYIKAEDSMQVINIRSMAFVYKDDLPADAVRVTAVNDQKTWATAATTIVEDVTGRKVVPGVHAVIQGYDGTWNYTRNMQEVKFLGTSMWIPKTMTIADIPVTTLPASVVEIITQAVTESTMRGNAVKRTIFRVFARNGDMLAPSENADATKLRAGYFFDWRDLPLKLIETWLKGDFVADNIIDAPVPKMELLHKYGRMIIAELDTQWALKPAAGTKTKVQDVPVTEPVAESATF